MMGWRVENGPEAGEMGLDMQNDETPPRSMGKERKLGD